MPIKICTRDTENAKVREAADDELLCLEACLLSVSDMDQAWNKWEKSILETKEQVSKDLAELQRAIERFEELERVSFLRQDRRDSWQPEARFAGSFDKEA